jgi:hypothetical protein
VLVWFVLRAWPGTDNVFDQDNEGTAPASSFLFWHHAERKGGGDGEATVSGAIPTLVLHCSEVLRTNPVVRVVRVGPAALSVCAPKHFGFTDGSTFGFPAHGSAVLAVGVGRVVVVQTAQATRFLEPASAMLQKLLES